MLRLARQHAVQNFGGFFFVGIAFVARHHSLCKKRQRIEDAGFAV
jgi:hypothetical protein